MTFLATLNAGDLSRLASGAARLAPRNGAIPILGAAKLEMGTGALHVTGSDMDQVICLSAPAKGHGKVAPSAQRFAAIAATLAMDQDVELSLHASNVLLIKQGSANFQIPTLPADDFPPTQASSPGAIEFHCDSDEFIAAVAALNGTVEVDIKRPYLSGLFLDVSGKTAKLVGTDGKGLGCFPVAIEAGERPPKVIIPLQALSNVLAVAKTTERLLLWASTVAFGCAADGCRYQTKVLEGTYPDWSRYRRAKSATTAMVEMADIRRVSERLRATELPYVKLETGETIKITGIPKLTGGERGVVLVTEEFPAHSFEGSPTPIAVSSDNLRWLVESFPGVDVLEFGIEDAESPVIVTAPGQHKDNLRILIQVRI